jgi:predicted O-linked N-acetylglucosamine transferase (SPINDLY family)
MGAPVLTLIGSTYAGRQGADILNVLGLPEFAANKAEEFVEMAKRVASDRDRLREVRAGLRERLRASPICDAERFTRNLEAAYRVMAKECKI